MKAKKVWRVAALIRTRRDSDGKGRSFADPDPTKWSPWSSRVVYVLASDFAGAYQQAEEAVMANWSAAPHQEVQVLSISPYFAVKDDQMQVTV